MADPTFSTGVADAGLTLSDSADARTVARFRKELSQWLRATLALDPVRLNDVLLAVNEALTNAAEFAYAGQNGTMTMNARYDAAGCALVVDDTDRGLWRVTDPRTQSNTRGRGIPLMEALADRTTISALPSGTHVRLQFSDCALISAQPCATPA
jgi:anti-sigma regulatory factor (Ser/Thr protein kinase)